MSASSSSRPRLAASGIVLTARDLALLTSLWQLRCATRVQLQPLHFTPTGPVDANSAMAMTPEGKGEDGTETRASSACIRRLGLLRIHDYLAARRLPQATGGGAAPYVYTLGPRAVPLLAEHLDLEMATIARRVRQDARLSWLFYAHRQALTDLHIALLRSCRQRGATLQWRGDEEVAAAGLTVMVGKAWLPVRPDAACMVTLPEGGKTSFFIELQRTSRPGMLRRKAAAHAAFWTSGAYTEHFGARSLRVLTVVDAAAQVSTAQERLAGIAPAELFWIGVQTEVVRDPFGPVWAVAGQTGRCGLLDGAALR